MIDLSKQKQIYTRTTPCITKIKEKVLLNSPLSAKKTYHISLDTRGTNLDFSPGDSLSILPQNDPKLIKHLFSILEINPAEVIFDPKSNVSLTVLDYFCQKVNLARISSSLLRYIQENSKNPTQREQIAFLLLPENKQQLHEFTQNKDLLDLFLESPLSTFSLQELCGHLAPLLPRFYSISSSLKAHQEEVHILVALSSHIHRNEVHYGVASHFLCNLAQEYTTDIQLYVQPTHHFRVPEEAEKSLIMVRPGTGIAPFRAFLQERRTQKNSGKNWLFLGGRNRQSDFFYEDFWSTLQQEEKLKVSTAFSRDQAEKEYVQHKLWEEKQEIWNWLEAGALFYVCGDASQMAKDVEATVLRIIQAEGNLSEEEAKHYFKALKASKRYLTDVY